MTPAPPLLTVSGLRKSFFGVEVVRGVSFALQAGQSLGVIGENGSGKSTTMNMVAGLLVPDAGTMTVAGRPYAPQGARDAAAAGIAFIQQELNLFDSLSVAENLAIRRFPRRLAWLPHIDRRAMRRRAEALLADVAPGIRPETPVSRLPQGERQLVEIAKALADDARIIVFDEPSTSLTTRECDRLFALVERLRGQGLGIIYISHILDDVLRLCDRVLVLRDGEAIETREATVPGLVELMLGRPLAGLFPPRAMPPAEAPPALEVRGLSQPGIVSGIDFAVAQGEVVGLAGLMGSGRSETARILFGLDPAATGELRVLGRTIPRRSPRACMAAGMAFLTEDRRGEGLIPAEGVLSNVALARLADLMRRPYARLDRRALAAAAARQAEAVRVRYRDPERQEVRSLSGGNQQKVVLAKWLLRGPRVFVLDEPTRGIDVGAKAEIYGLIAGLASAGAGILMISSDLEELFGTCHRILVMSHGEIAGTFRGPAFDRGAIRAAMALPQGRRMPA